MVHIKIYPSKHEIKLVNESRIDTDLNVPLSFINLDYNEYNIKAKIEKDFLKSSANDCYVYTPIIPNQEINIFDTVFNQFGEPQDSSRIINRIGESYYYTPPQSFVPNLFTYSVTIKKDMRKNYRSSKKYNIDIGCIEYNNNGLASKLNEIFINPAGRSLLTPNIIINNNEENSECLTSNIEDKDFIFMKTSNGFCFDKDRTQEAGIDSLLSKHINVWVGCDIHHKYGFTNDSIGYVTYTNRGTLKTFTAKNPIVNSKANINSENYYNLLRPEMVQSEGVNVHQIFNEFFTPVLILEHKGKAFEIISNNDVLDNPVKYKDLIYEVMMYVYLLSYKQSDRINEWITYDMPGYEVVNNQLHTKQSFASSKKLTDIFRLDPNDYKIYKIDIFDNNTQIPVETIGISSPIDNITCNKVENDRLVFSISKTPNSQYKEPEKPTGWISIYKDGKVYYADKIYYMVESDLSNKLFLIEENNNLVVRIYPFKSSKYGLNFESDLVVTIPYIKTEINGKEAVVNDSYWIYIDRTNDTLYYCQEEEYDAENVNLVKIAKIDINQSMDQTYLTDIRQLGGGLREDAKDDFNMLDIGHINGRPYRKGNTLVITMPTKYKDYEDKILEAVNKYKVGEDYVVVFFEDKE